MKRLSIKLFTICCALLTALSCSISPNHNQDGPDIEFSRYIEAYSGSIISCSSPLIIELASPAEVITGSDEEIRSFTTSLFKFSPSVKGTATWESPTRVRFTPEGDSFQAGTRYKCTFDLGSVAQVPKDYSKFEFNFITSSKEAYFDDCHVVIKENNPKEANISGRIVFSDVISTENPATMLTVKADGNIGIAANCQGSKCIRFTISGIQRPEGKNWKTARISFNPGATGFEECMDVEVSIPPRGDFQIIGSKYGDDGDGRFDIIFSEPLERFQDLTGLVSLTFNYYRESAKSLSVENNILSVYYNSSEKPTGIRLEKGIAGSSGDRLKAEWSTSLTEDYPLPEVTMPAEGTILPEESRMIFPFNAVNLSAVDVSVVKIYPGNIPMFLQENSLNQRSDIRRAGRLIYKKTIRLDTENYESLKKMQTYTADLSGLFKRDPKAIYSIKISFKPEYYIYNKDRLRKTTSEVESPSEEEMAVWDSPFAYYSPYNWQNCSWRDRDNPHTESYYAHYSFPQRNVCMSNIGIIAKYSDVKDADGKKSLWIAVTDLNTGEAVSGAGIKVSNYQLQEIGKGKSNRNGLTDIEVNNRPFLVEARKGESVTYLKVTDGLENSLSRFDTGGKITQKGIKGYVYGERGVWRPGDTLHLNLLVQGNIPEAHPVTMDIYSPEGQFFTRKIEKGKNGLYSFTFATGEDSPTGKWNAYFKLGGATFHKSIQIESIKPNRLKINTSFNETILQGGKTARMDIAANWLTGPAASGLKSRVEMRLRTSANPFKQYKGYTFTNQAASFDQQMEQLAETTLGKDGKASVSVKMPQIPGAPGMLESEIISYVTEEGGDESLSVISKKFSPFSAYCGILLPETENGVLETGKKHFINAVILSPEGNRVYGHQVEWRIFKLKWSWWWESRREPLDSYINGTAATAISSGTETSGGMNISIPFSVSADQWGRYLIYVKDLTSGHISTATIFADDLSYGMRSSRNNPDAPEMLTFSLDKKSYKAGETATVFIPRAAKGKALVSLENSRGVISSEWVDTDEKKETEWKFKVTPEMAPNIYVHITMVKPYSMSDQSQPLRMYGVIPVMVDNPESRLSPIISMPDKLAPEKEFTIKVSEKSKKPMTYTIAIVDEGLLDITAFRTPDPWNTFYSKEALGVRTWDMYNDVFKAQTGAMRAMFSIGGDEDLIRGARKENRFNPVVKHLGPFTLKPGSIDTHKVKLPMYVGSVRVMLVAGNGTAYGSTDKTVPVTSPIMILPTLPRTAGAGEKITLPVNVFAMEDGISQVRVNVRCEGAIQVDGNSSETVQFSKVGDKMTRFRLTCANTSGKAKVHITAEGNGHTVSETINLDVRNTSPLVISSESRIVRADGTVRFEYEPFDATSKDQGVWIEAGHTPGIDWGALLSYMDEYPHSCSEQLASKGICLINALESLKNSNHSQVAEVKAKTIIPDIINELYSRQLSNGGFAYWPGGAHSDEWVTSMIGVFFARAKEKGFSISNTVLSSWSQFQKQCISNYKSDGKSNDMIQAYRLYSLAVAKQDDKAAMNRLKLSENLSTQASVILASAYSICGNTNIGISILTNLAESSFENLSDTPNEVYTYGSALRDKALVVEAYARNGMSDKAIRTLLTITDNKPGVRLWSLNTQESSFLSTAVNALTVKTGTGKTDISIDCGKGKENHSTGVGFARIQTDAKAGFCEVTNNSDSPIYIRMSKIFRPEAGSKIEEKSSGLALSIRYTDEDGEEISPFSLKQGTILKAQVKVTNPDISNRLNNLALTLAIPSGWEIINDRLTGAEDTGGYDRLDIRDERAIYYFGLNALSSKVFSLRLRAAYEGEYILPSISCESMYDTNIFACSKSGKCSVTH